MCPGQLMNSRSRQLGHRVMASHNIAPAAGKAHTTKATMLARSEPVIENTITATSGAFTNPPVIHPRSRDTLLATAASDSGDTVGGEDAPIPSTPERVTAPLAGRRSRLGPRPGRRA